MLALIVPSRNRPDNIAALIRALDDTRSVRTHLIVCVDDDDPHVEAYRRICARRPSVALTVGPRLRLGPTLNKAALDAAGLYRWVGFMGDDHRPRTVDWDEALVAACDTFGLAYGNDLLQGENLPTEVVMTSNIVTALGYMCPPDQVHMYLDNFWLRIGRALDAIAYLPDVIVEHMHPVAGKADGDVGYGEANAYMEPDRIAFEAYLATGFEADVVKLQEVRDGSTPVR